MNLLKQAALGVVLTAALFLVAGCQTSGNAFGQSELGEKGGYARTLFRVGELVTVSFSGTETPIPDHQERVKEDGTITLSLIGAVKAEGKTPGQLQRELRELYVPRFYGPNFNVTVKSQDRFFYVGGEVKTPNRYLWVEGMTVVKAIQNAGGLTEWAKPSKVQVRRQGKTFTVNYQKALLDPSLDVDVYPDDSINVVRRGW